MENQDSILEYTVKIVTAYVGNNEIPTSEIPKLIDIVHNALKLNLANESMLLIPNGSPAVEIEESVFDEYIICLEDGQRYKSLKRHLGAKYNLTPDQYRQKWGLPASYPMVAPAYAKRRSELARQIGLGRKRQTK